MNLRRSATGRIAFGLIAAMILVSGCAQRRAEVVIPQGSPPRAAVPEKPWPNVPPPPQPRGPVQPVPPVYTPQPPIARLPVAPSPNADVPPDLPSEPGEGGTPPSLSGVQPPPDLSAPGTRPGASEDYSTLLGDGDPTGDTAPEIDGLTGTDDESPYGPYSGAGGGVGAGESVLVALLVPETDKRPSVRNLADGLAKAASLAAADLNEPRLTLRQYDTAGDPRQAAEAAKQALADGAKLIIGPLFSGSAVAVRPVAQQAGVSTIAFTTDESVLGGGLYSIGFLPQTEIERIISYTARRGLTNIAALAPDTPYGRVIYDQSRAAAARSGATIVRVQPFKPDFTAMDATAKDFADFYKNAKVDAILMATSGKTLQGLSSYLAYRKVLPTKVKYIGLGLWDERETLREPSLRGGWFPGVDRALKADFDGRYKSAYGSAPPSISVLGYDAVAVAAALLRADTSGKPFSAQTIQRPSGFSGMSGLFRFRPDGRSNRALSILEVGSREFRVIEKAPRDFADQAGG